MSHLIGDIEDVEVPSQSTISAFEGLLQTVDLEGEAFLQIGGRRIRVYLDPAGKPRCEEML
jgi:hypothetical protein